MRLILENLQPWNAAEFLLRDLRDYPLLGGELNYNLERDKQQIENFLLAYGSFSHVSKTSHKANGPLPVLSGDLSIADWKRVFSKLTVASAAECVIANVIFDAAADYGYCVTMLKRVLTAWTEIHLVDYGIGNGNDRVAPEPHNSA